MNSQRGNRYVSTLSLTSRSRPGLFTPGEIDPVPILQVALWDPGPVSTGAENLAPTGIISPDSPAPSQSLYRLSYRGLLCQIHSRYKTLNMKAPVMSQVHGVTYRNTKILIY